MKFSVVVPVYNHQQYVLSSLLSVLAARDVDELLVMDDGSTDASARILEAIGKHGRPRVVNCTADPADNRGAPACLNHLCERASGDWIAVLNSDDLFVPGRFFYIGQALRSAPANFVFGRLLVIDGAGKVIGEKRGPLDPEYPFPPPLASVDLRDGGACLDLLANQNFIATTGNMVFTKALWEKVGGFRDYRYVHDWDFALRACVQGTPQFVSFPLTSYRLHPSNTIKESAQRVDAEVQEMFRRLIDDFPAVLDRPGFAAGLAANRHATSPAELLVRDERLSRAA